MAYSSALAMEILQSWTKPSIYIYIYIYIQLLSSAQKKITNSFILMNRFNEKNMWGNYEHADLDIWCRAFV